jgi:TRAP-type C4-dicarboxylate transport system substrate-binding protein
MRARRKLAPILVAVAAAAVATGCAASGSGGSSGSASGGGGTYTIKFTSTQQPSTPNGQLQYAFAKLVQQESGGRIQVKVYPNSILGSEDELIPQVISGTTQMTELFAPQMAQYVSGFNFFQVPMIFTSQAAVIKGLQSPATQALNAQFLQKTGVKVLGWGSLGFVQLLAKQPVVAASDFSSLKIRIAPGSVPLEKSLPMLGAQAVPLAESDDFTSEQSGLVNGIVNPAYTFVAGKDYENFKNLTQLNFQYNPNVILINAKFFNSLPASLQKIVQSAADQTTAQEVTAVNKASATAAAQLEAQGVKVTTLSGTQRQAVFNAIKPYLKSAVSTYGAGLFQAFGVDTSGL